MDKLKYIKLENEDGSYSESIPLAVDSDYVDVQGTILTDVLISKASINQVNAVVNNLQNEINSLASGSPKGTYTTISALISANPETGVYIVTADGHIYSWTQNGDTATDLGAYQSTGIANSSIDISHLNNYLTDTIDVKKNKVYNGNFYHFGLSGSTGIISGTSDTRMCTDVITNICSIKLTPETGYKFHLFTYDENDDFIESTGWKTIEYIANTHPDYKYRVLVGKTNDSSISENGVAISFDELNHDFSYADLDAELKNYIKINEEKINLAFELGGIDSSGVLYDNTRSIRTSNYYQFTNDIVLNCYKYCQYNVVVYDKNKNFVSKSSAFEGETKFQINPDCYYKFVVYLKSQAIMNANMGSALFEVKYFTTLSDVLNNYVNKNDEDTSDYIMEFAAPYYSSGSILSDLCLVNDELFLFGTSDDEHVNKVYGHSYILDMVNKRAKYVKRFTHNFGHVNTINYCKETDCLIFGNGSGDYSLLGKFYVYPNFYANYKNGTTEFLITDCIEYDCSSISIGSEYKFNALWGDNNYGKYDIVVLITNDNRNIRTIQLGKGTNQLENGTFISGKADNEFNGTFKIQREYTQDTHGITGQDPTYCVQGASYNNGYIYCGIGHGHIEYWKMRLTNNSIIREEFFDYVYNSEGTDLTTAINGIEVTDNYVIFSYRGRVVVYKNTRL